MNITVKGHVQKVGYRYAIYKFIQDQELHITGEIKNCPDGTVSLIAEGSLEELKSLHQYCKSGVERATVRDIQQELNPIDSRSYNDFIIY